MAVNSTTFPLTVSTVNGQSGNVTINQPYPNTFPFAMQSQTAQPSGTIKFQNVTLTTVNGVPWAICSGGNSPATICAYNISNPLAPVLGSSLTLLGSYGAFVQGNYAYVPSSGGYVLYVVSIADPTNLVVVGSVNIGSASGSLYSCVVSGNYCYIATQSKGLTVVDVTNPAAPVQVFQEGGTTNKSFGVAISGTTVYTTNYQTATPWTVRYFKTWSVATPTAPVLQNTYTLPANTKPLGIYLWGNYAAIGDGNQNIYHLLNITTPTAPAYLYALTPSGTTLGPPFNVQVNGNYLYAPSQSATLGGVIDMFDITNIATAAPTKFSTFTTGVATSAFGNIALDTVNNYIYCADYGIPPGNNGTLDVIKMPFQTATIGYLYASSMFYAPGIPGNWASTPPVTIESALDRMSTLLKTLNSNNPIP